MKIKTKLLTMVSLMALTAVLLMVGVWALKTVNFTVGGNLSYIAPGIEATISKGTMSNGVWVNAGDASTKMPLTKITRTDTEESLEEKFSYWQDLNLTFNETGDDVTITFSITNDMAEKYLSINVTTSYASADNATISLNTSSVELEPDASQSFTITLAVPEKTENASLSAFAIVFSMEMVEPPKPVTPEEVSYLTFEYDDDTLTATLTGATVTSFEVPAKILKNNKEYTVTAVGEDSFAGKDLKTVKLPDTIERIGIYSFVRCFSLSINIPTGLKYVGDSAFDYGALNGITELVLDSIIEIGEAAFGECTEITKITLGSSVTKIGYGAFACYEGGSPQLTEVVVKATTPPTLGDNAFYHCDSLATIKVPKESLEAYKIATNWSAYAGIMVGV